jgi:ABC-2 type transport system permease protein
MIPIRPRRVAAVVIRYAYLLRASPVRVLPIFAWVTIDVVLWGFLARWLVSVSHSGVDFVTVLLGAVLLWDLFGRVLQGVTMTFFEDVWTRNLLNVFASPITVAEYVTGLVLSTIGTSAVSLAVMVVLATAVFGLALVANLAFLAAAVLVLFLFGIALGIGGCAIVLRLGPSAEWIIWPIPAVLSPLVGVFYPIAVLPGWMRAISWVLPPSHVFEAARAVVAGGQPDWARIGLAAALALGQVVVAGWIFVRVHRHAVQTGLLARYSAEGVT